MKKSIIIILAAIVSAAACAQTWQNPFSLHEDVTDGIGDPYILKYKGIYYLYTSNGNHQTLKCWSSKDLVNWSDAIICSTDPTIEGAYAPEVIHWNGMFYMYTSPHGGGHYTLSSNSPTGPFTVVTGNWGKEIDGSAFIDDDGSMYFYHAHNDGIHGSTMPTPTTFGASVNLGARMNNQWTEGPCVFKRDGIYYLLYTGNHVLSKGYRIDYAQSSSPISAYTPQAAQNPILVQSEGSFVGLGHGSAFIGPDLDTYYFTYHNLNSASGGAPFRKFNFDRIAWNGNKLSILGPTNWIQQNPPVATADYFDRDEIGTNWTMPNGGNWGIGNQDYLFQNETDDTYKAVFTSTAASDYTAEFTIREVTRKDDSAKLGAVFSYSNEQNYGTALFHTSSNRLEINFRMDNVWGTPQYFNLPSGFNYAAWHSIRIEKERSTYKFFVDGMKKASVISNLQGGKVGYMTDGCQGNFSYIALSDKVNGSGIYDIYKPVPGIMSAMHYNTGGEGVGYHDLTPGNSGTSRTIVRNDSVDVSRNNAGGYHISNNTSGEWYKYNVNVKSTGIYNVDIRYSAVASNQIRIWQGETALTGAVSLPSTGNANTWRTFTVKDLNLSAGYQTLKIETVAGDFNFYEMKFVYADNSIVTQSDDFDNGFSSDWNYSDGDWQIESGAAALNGFGKRTLGSTGWTDYTIEADITYVNAMNAGIIFRVNNPAIGGANDNPSLGTDYLQGYFVGMGNSNVALGKHNYGWESLTSAPGSYSLNTTYHVKIVASGANIKVYVDDMDTPKIDYTDANPFTSGKAGFRVCNSHTRFDNFSVTTSYEQQTGIKEIPSSDLDLFPNPVSGKLTVRNMEAFSDLAVYNMNGQRIYGKRLSGQECIIDTSTFSRGLYLLRLSNEAGNRITRRFVKI
jgi:hypothetical protein